jgi:exosortase/archaeosortase family protein
MKRGTERGPLAPAGRPGAAAPSGTGDRKAPRRAEIQAVLGFLARFAGGWISILLLLAFVPAIEHWAVRNTISSLLFITHLFRLGSSTGGESINISGVSIEIVPDCTPLMPTAALWIAIASFPAPWRWRLAGLAAGALLLWLYNLARILALIPVLAYRPQLFDFIHVYLWQTVTLLVVFALFLLWLRLQQPGPARA